MAVRGEENDYNGAAVEAQELAQLKASNAAAKAKAEQLKQQVEAAKAEALQLQLDEKVRIGGFSIYLYS